MMYLKSPGFPKNQTISDIFKDIRRPEPGADTAWYQFGPSEAHGINYTNSWVNVTGATNAPGGWYLNDHGETRLRGKITGGTVPSLIAVLPEEIRPEFTTYHPIDTDEEGNYSLDNIRFRAFQNEDDET